MTEVRLEDDAGILNGLRVDPRRTLGVLYQKHKQTFLGFLRRIGGDPDLHIEVYHDAILAFYDIWLDGRYDATRASISTLLCAIGKNKLLTRLAKERREVVLTELDGIDIADKVPDPGNEGLTGEVEKALGELGEGCREIIILFYYHKRNIRDIVKQLNYKNENVVKAHKSRCMKRLREILQPTTP